MYKLFFQCLKGVYRARFPAEFTDFRHRRAPFTRSTPGGGLLCATKKPALLQSAFYHLLLQHGLLLLLGLGLYLVDKYEGLPPTVIMGVLLLTAAVKTGYFLLHNFRALAALRETFQQFLLLVSLNLSMIARSFALDFYYLYRINDLTFAGLRPGSGLDIFGQLVYQSVGTLISNSGGTLSAAARTCCWRRLPVSFRRCSLFRTRPATSAPWQNPPPARRYCRPRRPK